MAFALASSRAEAAKDSDTRFYVGFSLPFPGAHNFRTDAWHLLNLTPLTLGLQLSPHWVTFFSPQVTMGITDPQSRADFWLPFSLNYMLSPLEAESNRSPYVGAGFALQLRDRTTGRNFVGALAQVGWMNGLSPYFVYRAEIGIGYRWIVNGDAGLNPADTGGPILILKLLEWGHWF